VGSERKVCTLLTLTWENNLDGKKSFMDLYMDNKFQYDVHSDSSPPITWHKGLKVGGMIE
jgi:hypothetical protein